MGKKALFEKLAKSSEKIAAVAQSAIQAGSEKKQGVENVLYSLGQVKEAAAGLVNLKKPSDSDSDSESEMEMEMEEEE